MHKCLQSVHFKQGLYLLLLGLHGGALYAQTPAKCTSPARIMISLVTGAAWWNALCINACKVYISSKDNDILGY